MDSLMRLFQGEAPPVVDAQPLYQAAHAWALRGMGYGLGDHPTTSGEREVLEVLAQRRDREDPGRILHVIDVGANVGAWAEMVAERFCDGAWIDCFEPSAAARAKFSVRSNRYHRLHAFGLSDHDRETTLHTDALGSGMASVHRRRLEHFGRTFEDYERARFRRLDDVCAELYAELEVKRVDLLKIDTEGHDLAVLRGAGEMLTSGAIGMIQFEFGGCNLDSRTTFQDFWYLLSPCYDLYRVVADGLVRVPCYREQDEVYICSNFVAIWRDHG